MRDSVRVARCCVYPAISYLLSSAFPPRALLLRRVSSNAFGKSRRRQRLEEARSVWLLSTQKVSLLPEKGFPCCWMQGLSGSTIKLATRPLPPTHFAPNPPLYSPFSSSFFPCPLSSSFSLLFLLFRFFVTLSFVARNAFLACGSPLQRLWHGKATFLWRCSCDR
jgi:hypothetical protein